MPTVFGTREGVFTIRQGHPFIQIENSYLLMGATNN